MGILDNEGHDPQGFGNTVSPRYAAELGRQVDELEAENRRLREAFVEAARLLTLEQVQGLSENSVRVLGDLGLLRDGQ